MGSSSRKCKVNINRTESEELIGPHIKKLSPAIFKDDSLTVGGEVKSKGEVLLQHLQNRCRPANTSCRIESFGIICNSFDDRRKRWVREMGFGGLLEIGGNMNLPRQLAYWLMTRVDPFNCTLTAQDGRVYRLSQNQVHWVLGIPNGGLPVPTYQTIDNVALQKVNRIMDRYGKIWSSKCSRTGREYIFEGIQVNADLIASVEGEWEEDQAEEFKTVFLLLSLEMLLCPNKSSRLASDLVPLLTCAARAADYDWCSLVLQKLMCSVAMFARRFYSVRFASGCAGCLIFMVVLYLDRLNRHPVHWGYFPRLEVWNMEEIRLAISEDRIPNGGDFGQLGTLDVAYGETHPTEARVSNGPGGSTERSCCVSVCFRSKTTRMRKPKLKKVYGKPTADMSGKVHCADKKAIIVSGNNNIGAYRKMLSTHCYD
ncbi:uncharacterized protein LOC110690724 isoform X2 [Chenopodium quinoa]|uniref:uncharacterized protein LOC110690724 isoform X2 n=1 Tax=Chenopodium quinoa TaxID=63459 RepID=UPI000B791F2E|nr:uncharacterized protein LOC110690724 isoform X2 [Chenopodium quinoa]